MRNPFAGLAKRDTPRLSLRDRAASLKASASRVIRRKPADAEVAGRALAARVVAYFGEGPIDADLNADIQVRDMARALLDGVAFSNGEHRSPAGADPILAAIDEMRRLTRLRAIADDLPLPAGDLGPLPEQTAAMEAQFAHIDNVLLKTVPTTAAGCVALARYAIDFLEADGWVLDENEAANQHVRILDLIARSPMLGSEPQGRPFVPDFSGYSAKDLMRTYNAFKLATDIMGLTGWTISAEGVGHRLLDAEGDRLSFFQGYIADELRRRDLSDRTEASWRTDTVINRAVACGDYGEAARFAAEADAKRL